MGNYGSELIIDMSGCDVDKFNRKTIKQYFRQLCEIIKVEPQDFYFWDDYRVPQEKRQSNPKTKGTTAIQFILTSNITIHTLDILGVVFVNIFSCQDYEVKLAEDFTLEFFSSKRHKSTVIEREIL